MGLLIWSLYQHFLVDKIFRSLVKASKMEELKANVNLSVTWKCSAAGEPGQNHGYCMAAMHRWTDQLIFSKVQPDPPAGGSAGPGGLVVQGAPLVQPPVPGAPRFTHYNPFFSAKVCRSLLT